MTMRNRDYWKQRFIQLENAQNQMGKDALNRIERQFDDAQSQIEAKITMWYQRFADNNGISLGEAKQYMQSADLKEFKWSVEEYIKYGKENDGTGKWMKELENASAKFHISKYEALKIHIQQSIEELYAKKSKIVDKTIKNIYKSGYYHTIYEIQKGFGIGWDIAGVDQSKLEKVISKPWAADGINFSERIWKHKNELISELHDQLESHLKQGSDPKKVIDAIAEKMENSKYNAGRLVMTEEAFFSSAAQKDCYSDLDVEKYEIAATLDSKTSDTCRNLDSKVFYMKDFEVGETAPPFHVWCRSTTVPYFDDDYGYIGTRAARGEDGKVYYIPADMNYNEWKKTFVDGGDKSGLEKVVRNDIINTETEEQKFLKSKIKDGSVKLEINPEKQNRHIKGTNEYKEGRSYLTISLDEAQKIVNEKNGTGKIHIKNKGEQIKEVVICSTNIGVDVKKENGLFEETPTKKCTIHYSKSGTHVVPAKEDYIND